MCPENETLTFREPTDPERNLLGRLLSASFQGRDQLRDQVKAMAVAPIDGNGSLRLKPSDPKPANVERRVPTEGSYLDVDGVVVHVLVHVINGLLDELEIYRVDSGTVVVAAVGNENVVVEQVG